MRPPGDPSPRYNAIAYQNFINLNIPVYTDKDEWTEYHHIKVDPVVHIEACSARLALSPS